MIDTDMPIVDAHHHIWDPTENYHPWLCDTPPIDFRYGDYREIRRPYLASDFRQDHGPLNVVGSVYVETEWDPSDPVGEARWINDVISRGGLPSVAVVRAFLDAPDVENVLRQETELASVRGIRHKPITTATPDTPRADSRPGSLSDPVWRDGFARLAPLGLSFDLQAPWWHFDEADRLASDFPDTRIIINHAGLPSDRGTAALQGWHDMIRRIAKRPNIAIKISGLGQKDKRWLRASNHRIVTDVIDLFGVERCLFASNFPVDRLIASYIDIFDLFFEATARLKPSERRRLFHDNAVAIYRLDSGQS